jgi:multidrug resistance efflux pump
MAKGRFNIKGTKDFIVAAVFCGFLCVWSIRDAWFPTEKVLKKHPREIAVSFKIPGVVKHVSVQPGDEVKGKVVLATLYDDAYHAKVKEAEVAFDAAKTIKDPETEKKLAVLLKARETLEDCTLENTDVTWKTTHGDEPLRGVVVRVLAEPATLLEAGAPVLTIAPVDTFYVFNKTLAILTFIGMIVSLVFHRIASR